VADGHCRVLISPSAPYRAGGRGTVAVPLLGGRLATLLLYVEVIENHCGVAEALTNGLGLLKLRYRASCSMYGRA